PQTGRDAVEPESATGVADRVRGVAPPALEHVQQTGERRGRVAVSRRNRPLERSAEVVDLVAVVPAGGAIGEEHLHQVEARRGPREMPVAYGRGFTGIDEARARVLAHAFEHAVAAAFIVDVDDRLV